MPLLSHISVRAKLMLLIACAAAGIVLVTVIGIVGLHQSSQQTRALVPEDFATLRQMGDLRASIGNMRRFEKDMFLNLAEEAALAKYQASWSKEVDAGTRLATGLAARLRDKDLEAIERMKKGVEAYRGGVDGIVAAIRAGKLREPAAANQAMEPLKGAVRAADQAFADLTDSVSARVDGRQAELEALEQRTLALTVGGAVAVIVLVTLLALLIGRRIVQPLRAAGDAMERIAEGDLTQAVAPAGRDEIGHLVELLGRMQASLAERVASVRSGIDGVATASVQIAQGGSDLSSRTERQAASLQETTASMQQLTQGVKTSAEHAGRASAIAAEARSAASHGGDVVGAVATAMGSIQDASRRIADITAVIDGIAFQTNILALNASVEAAPAGEQGRGFAVVAGEVRVLAQRAATAAREIKQLIQETTSRVDAGSRQATDAQKAMAEIVTQVGRVDDLIGAISRESGTQSDGIAQVGQAIATLDENTQQNAALVEESAAAADSLRQQADALTRAMQMFRIPAQA